MSSFILTDVTSENRPHSIFRKNYSARTYCVIATGIASLILAAVGVVYIISAVSKEVKKPEPPDPETALPPSPSILRKFSKGAVCSDGSPCSEIGRDILKKNGSAVDAAIATLFCNGIVNCQSMGLGGGFLMTIYDKRTEKSYVLNAREVAPIHATEEMYRLNSGSAKQGPLAIGVPGELAGYWAAHKRFGRLPWAEVVQPSLKICEDGYKMTKHQYDSLNFRPDLIFKDKIFSELFVDRNTGKFYPQGTLIIQRQICKTLRIIAERGGDDLYNGTLAKIFVNDIKEMGGIITIEDMQSYRVRWDDPVVMQMNEGIKLYSVPPPGGGSLVALILNILKGYNFNRKSILSTEDTIVTYHRIIEAFKFAFGQRTELGDPRFVDTAEIVRKATDAKFGDLLRAKINDTKTFKDSGYYGGIFTQREDHGTAHVSVISPDGDAVSVTSTVNLYFGAGVTSKSTGIVLNSGMNDFSSKYFENYFNLPLSPANKLEPKKQPLSSMSPTIMVDHDGNVKMVLGAAGGTKITTSVAYVIIRYIWFGEDIKRSVDASRIHHQLLPKHLFYEYGVLQEVVKGLQNLGHEVLRLKNRLSVVCAIVKLNETIFANADYRKGGDVHGF